MSEKQVKSKQRVADHGEVFTNEREVKAMCDLVKQETERIDSRFLEPACGEGAFLTEILRRKLAVVKSKYGKSPFDYERYAVLAITSIYGVDIWKTTPRFAAKSSLKSGTRNTQPTPKRKPMTNAAKQSNSSCARTFSAAMPSPCSRQTATPSFCRVESGHGQSNQTPRLCAGRASQRA